MSQDLFGAYRGNLYIGHISPKKTRGDFLLGYFHSVALGEGFMSRHPQELCGSGEERRGNSPTGRLKDYLVIQS